MTDEIVVDSREHSQTVIRVCSVCVCVHVMRGLLRHVLVSYCGAMQVLKSTAIRKYAGDLAYKDRALATDDALLIGRLHTYLSGNSMLCTFALCRQGHAAAWHLPTIKRCTHHDNASFDGLKVPGSCVTLPANVGHANGLCVTCCQKHTAGLSASSLNVEYLIFEHVSMQAGQRPTLLSYRVGDTPSASASLWCNRNVWLCGVAMIRY